MTKRNPIPPGRYFDMGFVKSPMKSDRVLGISEVRTIKHQHERERDERVVKITMELTAAEIVEVKLALDNHIDRMTKNNWHYGEMKTVQRVLRRALEKLRKSHGN